MGNRRHRDCPNWVPGGGARNCFICRKNAQEISDLDAEGCDGFGDVSWTDSPPADDCFFEAKGGCIHPNHGGIECHGCGEKRVLKCTRCGEFQKFHEIR